VGNEYIVIASGLRGCHSWYLWNSSPQNDHY